MVKEEIYNKIVSVLVDEFEVDKESITFESNLFTELELDSLDAIDLMVTLDKELGIEIKTEEMQDILTVKDVYDFIVDASNNG